MNVVSDRFGWCWVDSYLEQMILKPLRDWEATFLDRAVDTWLLPDA